ncbi:MAG TPA: hypothetical protein VFA32_25035, partial [Dehalococcoidia bacterium]|nr:hypothetical protein [Dehalococcoidia bacterium]
PSRAGATSWGRDPAGTGNDCIVGSVLGTDDVGNPLDVDTGTVGELSANGDAGPAVAVGVGPIVGTDMGSTIGVGDHVLQPATTSIISAAHRGMTARPNLLIPLWDSFDSISPPHSIPQQL